ncbi:UDP-N-acetylmuramoylalanine--D-glutamate ligase [Steroidobacter agaridevorans]|uniref:UDP-N-acetylmuramoylalanine--D-glutamate ligase n=1 Tax=Steroidobacter agaridevorans TaxID=2695856 RepID=A0A829YEV4_9GAMM|nr:UDP-N-acetylmuramoyl-L-alanine--D-glutamate ligase [Steroidobacter agaridevorans]GFE81388.1 UDP-N-acetylmuramoylalanine--D-glutamate ligase [Steroidobacter agaridevorans]GFE88730.1 UDP-N-acetylmuramoylalanine--D-glutamate ligase [Steroidobacter agaridevorans]
MTQQQRGRSIVVGLGRTGLSCARYLQSRGLSFAVTDSRAAPPEAAALKKLAPEAELRFGGFDEALLDGASQIVASPGVSLKEPFLMSAAVRGIPIVGDIELFVREAKAPIAAITGTNGKSTVTTLVGLMANAAGRRAIAGGNLGRPALELLDDPVPELYVLELSSFQLETTLSLRAAAATVLNVTPDHMDRYATIEEYAAAKERIFQRAQAAIVNMDDIAVRSMRYQSSRVFGFSLHADTADYYVHQQGDDVVLMHGRERMIAMSELKIRGLHNAANALASIAMCDALNLSRPACLQALREFAGLPHRSQWVADVKGVRFVDDSKGTNVGATLAAVAGMPGSLVLIAGGQGKGQDFQPLAQAFRGKVRHVVLIGQDAKQIDAALHGIATTQFAKDMNEAVQSAANAARPGETVLLSPACASLDMFRDYGHRGDVFAAAVRGLQA